MKTHIPVSCRDLSYIAQVDDLEPWSLDTLITEINKSANDKCFSTRKRMRYYTISGVIAGGEAGVDMADVLSERLGVLSNGAKGEFANRRDKKVQVRFVWFRFRLLHCLRGDIFFHSNTNTRTSHFVQFLLLHTKTNTQQELVRKAGMRAVRQACGETFEEVHDFLKSETFPVVLKPTDSGMYVTVTYLSLPSVCMKKSHCSPLYVLICSNSTNK